jgi:hypothetical protein
VYRSSGNVGIGLTNPAYTLDVTGTGHFTGAMTIDGATTLKDDVVITDEHQLKFTSTNGAHTRMNILLRPDYNGIGTQDGITYFRTSKSFAFYKQGSHASGYNFNPGTGGTPATFMVIKGDAGDVGIGTTNPGYKLHVVGTAYVSSTLHVGGALSKASGSFMIDHPLPEMKETHNLYHSFIEGPRADLIYRGTVRLLNGRATINIDATSSMTSGTFEALNRDVQSFTSNESDWDPVRSSVVGNVLTIECQNPTSTALISWMVIGERNDKHMYDTDWTDENGRVVPEQLKKSATT